ncbi:MAG: arylsulfatase [Puniceicoccaceae bacterium]
MRFVVAILIQALAIVALATQPNVILVITDDQGYGDLSSHGNPILQTPNMDKLHAESVRLTNFHVDPTCAPTRGALLSGKYAHRARTWHTIAGGNHLRASEMTMADAFKASGYRTGLFGKWHLGSNYPYRPMDRGFDEWLGQGDGGTGTTDDWFFNDRINDHYWHNGKRVYRDGYAPDVFFDAAIDFIQESDDPFFAYVATYVPHGPHTIPDVSWTDNYKKDVADAQAWFFASIARVDWNLGRLRKALDESGKAENTIVIFMTDNGGTAGVRIFNAGMRGNKGSPYDGGHRVPFFIHWPEGKLKHGKDVDDLNAHIDVLPTLIDLCGLKPSQKVDFDGRSFKKQLYKPELELPERTLFVETQRTFEPEEWGKTSGMTRRWRMVNNEELYDIVKDPGQEDNVIDQFPEVAESIRTAHKAYWKRVSPGDRDKPRFIVGHKKDPETYLSSSDWYLPAVPWNHAQVANGSTHSGSWDITIAQSGTYRFEVRRWPREADATIQGVPVFTKDLDAWDARSGKEKLIYGDKMKALPVHKVTLEISGDSKVRKAKKVKAADKAIVFEIPLQKGDMQVTGTLLDEAGEVIAGAYYVYVRREG